MPNPTQSVEQPGVDFYVAGGHDRETAEALAGMDAICATHAKIGRMSHALRRPSSTRHVPRRGSTRGAGRPATRRTSSSSRTASQDPGDGDPEPPSPRRLESRAEIGEWLAERKATLKALVQAEGLGQQQLGFGEEVGS
jgi:hypothetical protein